MKNNHYFSKDNTNLSSNPNDFKINLLGNELKFKTDNGVFSKGYIDFGSKVLIETFTKNKDTLLDVGCGYGIIGISLSKAYSLNTLMVDVNDRAVALANENANNNDVDAKAIYSDIYENVMGKEFSSIVTNPPIRAGKKVVFDIYEGAFNHLEKKGELWVVIQKKQGAPSSIKRLEEIFGNCEIINKKSGYFILKCVKG